VNATYDYDLICIGSGPAGQRAAVQAAKLGLRAAVVEKQRCAGGVCVDTGTIPSKTLREAVIFLTGTGSAVDPRRRIRTEGRPTAEQLLSRVDDVVAREQAVIEDQLRRNDVTLLQGEGSFLDPHRLQIVGEGTQSVSASRILIAVGDVVPALPTHQGCEEPTGIGRAETTGMFGQRHKGQPGTLAGANQPVFLCLRVEGEQPCGLSEIVRDNML
jgi:NAD(P) transhydrogenase